MESRGTSRVSSPHLGFVIAIVLVAFAVVTVVRNVWPSRTATTPIPASAQMQSDVYLTPHGAYADRFTGLRFALGPATAESITDDGVCYAVGHPQDAFTAYVTITNIGTRARTVPTNWLELWHGRQYVTYGNAGSSPEAPPSVMIRPHSTRSIRIHYGGGIGYGTKAVTIRWDDQSRVSPYPPPVVGTYTVAPTGFDPCGLR